MRTGFIRFKNIYMKISVTIARIIVGVLFIFSGLVKAIDPLGLTYKMQEFFEVWARDGYAVQLMNWMYEQSFTFSIIIISIEVVLGVALLIGFKKKLVLVCLLILMMFFTFLTSYVLFSGKIATCGCFGDCIPLTPIQTFTKDILLLLLIIFLLFRQQYITSLYKGITPTALVLISIIGVIILQLHVIKHLPLKDCLPFKIGNNLIKLRQMPADAIPDKFDYNFVYQKGGVKKDFTTSQLPDSSWNFVERKQILLQKGKNNVPRINDFSLTDSTGADVIENLLNQKKSYYLFFIKDFDNNPAKWIDDFKAFAQRAKQKSLSIYIVTADKEGAIHLFNNINKLDLQIYTCDATAIKTAARANPTLFFMQGPVVQNKYSWADIDKMK